MRSLAILAGSLAAASQLFGSGSALTPDRVHLAAHKVVREDPTPSPQIPIEDPKTDVITSQGCFSSKGNMTKVKMDRTEVSTGSCRLACADDYLAFGVSGQECYCGNEYPEEDALSDDDNCDHPCPAYPLEVCGGIKKPGYMSVFNLGKELTLDYYTPKDKDDDKDDDKNDDKSKATSSTTAAAAASTATSGPKESASQTEEAQNEDKGDGGPSVAGIVAGSVVGVLAIAGGALGVWFFMRRRRNTEIEEEHRRNAAVNAFISGSKPPGSSGSISMTDSRLEPGLAHRRLSDGSIADNEDYSRKILRVTNA